MTVYLLHLVTPLHHARHYVGWTNDLVGRLIDHAEGRGARFTQVCLEKGIDWVLARTWDGANRAFERRIKNLKMTPDLCPICHPERRWINVTNEPAPIRVQMLEQADRTERDAVGVERSI